MINHDFFPGFSLGVPDDLNGVTSDGRPKRVRTSFKHHQLRAMKAYFAINHNPDAKDLKQLSQKTGLTKRVLQVWFQIARAKFRRTVCNSQSPLSPVCEQLTPVGNTSLIDTSTAVALRQGTHPKGLWVKSRNGRHTGSHAVIWRTVTIGNTFWNIAITQYLSLKNKLSSFSLRWTIAVVIETISHTFSIISLVNKCFLHPTFHFIDFYRQCGSSNSSSRRAAPMTNFCQSTIFIWILQLNYTCIQKRCPLESSWK